MLPLDKIDANVYTLVENKRNQSKNKFYVVSLRSGGKVKYQNTSQRGTIIFANLMINDKGMSKGYGFVCFSTPEESNNDFDPNGRQCLTMEGYRDIGQIVRNLVDDHCNGRILIVQEGGYHITYSAYCLHATLEGVLNLPCPLLSDPLAYYPEDDAIAVKAIESMKHYQTQAVSFLRET
ncbi:Histone deacetylase domain-containing protein [Cynara cardunculus var. scolymus]|uniref:Histone deacetylase domain-containing protein n=1 Tax=Cynara cardunculus var. scolymus TaxID=59895 RepID=A0A118K4W8_CYNCS|nr:Histone deacetylase domain-containing protein [Cynara cardunculus var. scolymus]